MKPSKFKLDRLLPALLAFAFSALGEERRQPDPSHPFGPSGMWFPDQAGWKLGNGAQYSIHLMCDPPLTYAGAEPIGFCIQNISSAVGKAKDEDPKQAAPKACSFEGLIWILVDQFGYSARVLIGPDGSLLGFSFRVWNNSKNHPLTLMREPGAALLRTDFSLEEPKSPDGSQKPPFRRSFGGSKRENLNEEWTLKPREKKETFMPIRDFLPKDFDPKDGVECNFNVSVNVIPKGTPLMIESPFPSPTFPFKALVTKGGLAMDPKEAMKEAEKNTPDIFKRK